MHDSGRVNGVMRAKVATDILLCPAENLKELGRCCRSGYCYSDRCVARKLKLKILGPNRQQWWNVRAPDMRT